MIQKVLDPSDVAKSEPDKNGGYDILVDLNQVGIPEGYRRPPDEIHFEGERFHRSGVIEASNREPAYWSYWNDGFPAKNLKLCLS